MKYVLLAGLMALMVGCANETHQTGLYVEDSSVEGSYFREKEQAHLTVRRIDDGSFMMDSKGLLGETKNMKLKKMTDQEIKVFFSNHNFELKKGDYFSIDRGDNQCGGVFIKFDGEDNAYVGGCIGSPRMYVKE